MVALVWAVPVAALLAWALARFIAVYVAFRRMELAIPGLPSLPLLGQGHTVLGVSQDNLWDFLIKSWNENYDLMRFGAAFVLALGVIDPDKIEAMMKKREAQDKAHLFYDFLHLFTRKGLIMLNGAEWRAHRKALQPAFHKEVLERFVDVIGEECEGFCARAEPNAEHDVTPNLTRVLAGSLLRTALVTEVSPQQERAIADLIRFMEVFFPTIMKRTFSPWLWPDWAYGLTRAARESKRLKADVDRFSQGVIDRRRATLREQIAHKSAAGDDFIKERQTLLDIMLTSSEAFSDEEILDEINMFAMAAIETTVTALGWTLKVLSVRPDVQQRVAREVADVLGDGGKVVDMHQLDRLEYTERVIKETMRLHPPVPFIGRESPKPTDFLGYRLPAGAVFVPFIHGTHRHPDHWPDPLRFDPDRFLPENCKERHPYAYLPFSVGPRNCIGSRQAMITMKTFVATVVQRFRVDPAADGHTDIASFPTKLILTAYMRGGYKVVLTPKPTASAQ